MLLNGEIKLKSIIKIQYQFCNISESGLNIKIKFGKYINLTQIFITKRVIKN